MGIVSGGVERKGKRQDLTPIDLNCGGYYKGKRQDLTPGVCITRLDPATPSGPRKERAQGMMFKDE